MIFISRCATQLHERRGKAPRSQLTEGPSIDTECQHRHLPHSIPFFFTAPLCADVGCFWIRIQSL